ncbi:hypothetical protein [Mesorhizobium intechi]|nr:hypothetical protein [Mesorhizobium intechi]
MQGDLVGVFEYDEAGDPQNATADFYLCKMLSKVVGPIIGTIHIRSGAWSITETDIIVKWDNGERHAGLFIHGQLAAAFDIEAGTRHGGGYGKDFHADIPWSDAN